VERFSSSKARAARSVVLVQVLAVQTSRAPLDRDTDLLFDWSPDVSPPRHPARMLTKARTGA